MTPPVRRLVVLLVGQSYFSKMAGCYNSYRSICFLSQPWLKSLCCDCSLALPLEFGRFFAPICRRGMGCSGLGKHTIFQQKTRPTKKKPRNGRIAEFWRNGRLEERKKDLLPFAIIHDKGSWWLFLHWYIIFFIYSSFIWKNRPVTRHRYSVRSLVQWLKSRTVTDVP